MLTSDSDVMFMSSGTCARNKVFYNIQHASLVVIIFTHAMKSVESAGN